MLLRQQSDVVAAPLRVRLFSSTLRAAHRASLLQRKTNMDEKQMELFRQKVEEPFRAFVAVKLSQPEPVKPLEFVKNCGPSVRPPVYLLRALTDDSFEGGWERHEIGREDGWPGSRFLTLPPMPSTEMQQAISTEKLKVAGTHVNNTTSFSPEDVFRADSTPGLAQRLLAVYPGAVTSSFTLMCEGSPLLEAGEYDERTGDLTPSQLLETLFTAARQQSDVRTLPYLVWIQDFNPAVVSGELPRLHFPGGLCHSTLWVLVDGKRHVPIFLNKSQADWTWKASEPPPDEKQCEAKRAVVLANAEKSYPQVRDAHDERRLEEDKARINALYDQNVEVARAWAAGETPPHIVKARRRRLRGLACQAVGAAAGIAVGAAVGVEVGLPAGALVGSFGAFVGANVGADFGRSVGK